MDTKQKGDITELEVLTYITKLGYQVSIPFGDRQRYDQIWDINNNLLRVQVKTSRPCNGEDAFAFSCKSNVRENGKTVYKKYSKDEIDYFATCWNEKCYLIPVEECGTDKKLRLNKPKNNQIKNISFAKDYEVEVVLEKYLY